MTDDKWTREQLASKVEHEGGVLEAIVGYGISPTGLPSSTPSEVWNAWARIYATRHDVDTIETWLDGE